MITRRHMLTGLSAIAAVRPLEAFAAAECSAPIGNRVCVAEVSLGIFETARQRCDSWCWAACIQTVFGLHGYDVDQQVAVERLFGDPDYCEGASVDQMVATIDGGWVDASGRAFRAQARQLLGGQLAVRSVNPGEGPTASDLRAYSDNGARQIVNLLSKGHPLIVGTVDIEAGLGHAVVLTGARWEAHPIDGAFSPTEKIQLTDIAVRDPWYKSENHRVLTAKEIGGAFWVVAVQVAGG